MRIEQRIGRVDRIGQEFPVEIYNFSIEGTVEDRIYSVLGERIRLFEETIGGLDPILGQMEEEIKRIIFEDKEHLAEQLAIQYEERIRAAREAENKMGDFIMDTHSFNKHTINSLLQRKPPFNGKDLLSLTRDFLSRFPSTKWKEGPKNIFRIDLPEAFLFKHRNSRLQDRYHCTFDLDTARKHEEIDFIAFGHKLLDTVVRDSINDFKDGTAGSLVLNLPEFDGIEGILFNYLFECEGVTIYRQLISIFVNVDERHMPELSNLEILKSFVPEETPLEVDSRLLIRAGTMETTSELIVQEMAEKFRKERELINKEQYQRETNKLLRMREYRTLALERRLNRESTLLREKELSQNPSDSKIVPAIRGRVNKLKKELTAIKQDFQGRFELLEKSRHIVYSYSLLNAAWIKCKG